MYRTLYSTFTRGRMEFPSLVQHIKFNAYSLKCVSQLRIVLCTNCIGFQITIPVALAIGIGNRYANVE